MNQIKNEIENDIKATKSDISNINDKMEKQINGVRQEFYESIEDMKDEIIIEVTDQI